MLRAARLSSAKEYPAHARKMERYSDKMEHPEDAAASGYDQPPLGSSPILEFNPKNIYNGSISIYNGNQKIFQISPHEMIQRTPFLGGKSLHCMYTCLLKYIFQLIIVTILSNFPTKYSVTYQSPPL